MRNANGFSTVRTEIKIPNSEHGFYRLVFDGSKFLFAVGTNGIFIGFFRTNLCAHADDINAVFHMGKL